MRRVLFRSFEIVLSVAVGALAFFLVVYDSVVDGIADMRRRRTWREGSRR